ncbi:MAG TPA: serine/threonine-protein kinase, partial [Polyangiaceae bacterium]|nr:serine/threonine-protein kinase [Polyangiaceae bacterium]
MSRQVTPAGQPLLTVGRYTLFGEIAKGGMATVHFGRMISLGGFSRTVAIKRMRRDIALDPEFIAMFIDEARLAARIEHPNVVATLDVVAEAGEVFLVMEYVKGETLARLARASESRGQPVPIQVACGIMCGALSGLHAAHEAVGESGQPLGIVHRDVSPQNVLVGEDGVPRITDFGIAKAETRLQVTHDGQMKGKLGYMAPEQLGGGGRRIDRRVDLFTAAIVLWELLAGRRLFLADSPAETIANILTGPVPPLRSIRQDVPPLLDNLVLKALSRDPQQRPATAEIFATSLEEAIDHRLASSRMIGSWVGSLAGHVLESRTRYVREIESIGIAPSDTQAAAAPGVAATSTPHERQPAPAAGAPRPPMTSKPLLSPDWKGGLAPPRVPGSVPSASPQPAPRILR